ncbi:MAG: hypothetical protein FJY29_00210 [Betaproteobacteria bacterium]|nr:hypothetical protein [Betaproteobacteria bacterium]
MKKETLDQHQQASGHAGIEPDNLPVGTIGWAVVALVIIVVGTVIGVNQLYWFTSSKAVQQIELDQPNTLLQTLNAADQSVLTTYDVVDQQKGIYRLPIDEAMKLYVQRNGN